MLISGEGNGTPLQYSHGWRSLEGCSPWGPWGSDTTERLHFHFSLSWIGEGNGNPLQCSCLENPRDRGAWCAAIYGVAQSWTWLKWLSSRSMLISILFQILFPFNFFFFFLQNIVFSSLWCVVRLSMLCIVAFHVVYSSLHLLLPNFQFSSYPESCSLGNTSVFSTSVNLFCK